MQILIKFFLSLLLIVNTTYSTELNITVTSLPESLDITKMWNYQHFLIAHTLYAPLIRISKNGRLVSGLARKWSVSQSGKDYTFTIYDNQKFTDGSEVTARDVVECMSLIIHKNSKSAVKQLLTHVIDEKSFRVIDKYKFSVSLKKAYPGFIKALAVPGFGIFKKSNNTVYGTGKYILQERSDESWTLARREGFKSVPEKILIKINHGNSINNKTDVAIGLFPEKFNLSNSENYKVTFHHSLAFIHFYFNTENSDWEKYEERANVYKILKDLVIRPYIENKKPYADMTNYFVEGLLPNKYYKEGKRIVQSVKSPKIKKNKRILRILLRKDYFTEDFVKLLKSAFIQFGYEVKIVFTTPKNFMKDIKSHDYDLVAGGYMGTFSDPDGFIAPLDRNNIISYGTFNTNHLIKEVNEIKYQRINSKRLKDYSSVMIELEKKLFFIPGYQVFNPIIHRKSIKLPDWDYKYEGELWEILKRAEI